MDRILLIDDDTELCDLLGRFLGSEGFEVSAVHNGAEGAALAVAHDFAVVVLDVMLPGLGGLDVLRRIRATSRVPVVMLTARGEDLDRILGLELGADDYVPKPFNPRELLARIRAVLRRSAGPRSAGDRLALGDLELDAGERSVRRGGEVVEVTTVEFDLLEALARDAGRVLSREELVRKVLGREFSPFDRSIDTHVSNLRKKLGLRPDGLDRIKSVRGAGYMYTRPAAGE
jgi:two-component system response regulator CpxR